MRRALAWTGIVGTFVLLLSNGIGCDWFKSQRSELLPTVADLNVVVLVIDTLRADHLPFYGYERNTAPFLSKLAEKSVLFERAVSTSSTTAPASASLFTGLYPSRHGVTTGYIATSRLKNNYPSIKFHKVPAELDTLGELFKQAGYRTYAAADNLNISREMGFDVGFDKFATYNYESADRINQQLLEWEPSIKQDGRYFMYIHYMDPHKPYNERAPWFEQYGPGKGRKQRWINAYDSEINFVDQRIEQMFERFGWLENSLVVVLADHGEEFWDHGGDGHGKTLHREVLHVPFMIYHPKLNKSLRFNDYVQNFDLLPTLAEWFDWPVDSRWEAKSLLPLMQGGEAPVRDFFTELLRRPEHPRTNQRSVLSKGWHFISTETQEGEPNENLYHLDHDWGEQQNIIGLDSELDAVLRLKLFSFASKQVDILPKEVEIEIDEHAYEQLQTLGYVE